MRNKLVAALPVRRSLRDLRFLAPVFLATLVGFAPAGAMAQEVLAWTSSQEGDLRMERLTVSAKESLDPLPAPEIRVLPDQTYQTLLGMGASLEPTTLYNLSRLSSASREQVISRLVSKDKGIGMNLIRICIGTPDFTADDWYSYNDLPEGETDERLENFSIEKDLETRLPLLRLAREKNPDLLFFASPWSPPGWMKTTGSLVGGSLLPQYYPSYALYFVKFIEAYEKEGIPIHAVTIQNEPGVDRSLEDDPAWHYPSCRWTAEQEAEFIGKHLGPAFKEHGIETEIWTYDHNFNTEPSEEGDDPGIDYPMTVLRDPLASRYVRGVAFHGYAGTPIGMNLFHKEFPEMPIYFTEGSTFGVKGAEEIIALFENGASSYNAWVTCIDENRGPNRGPFEASWTMITLDSKTREIEYRYDYFMYGQFMNFIHRGAVRVGTESTHEQANHTAWKNPDGTMVLVVTNSQTAPTPLWVVAGETHFHAIRPPESVTTFVWSPPDR